MVVIMMGRKRNGDGMDEAFVEHPERDVDGEERGDDEDGLVGERILKCGGGALEAGVNGFRETNAAFDLLNSFGGLSERHTGGEVERDGDGGPLSLVIDGERGIAGPKVCEGRERDDLASR